METTPPTTKLSEPLRYAAHEQCACGKERVTPADWDLVAQKNKEHGEFLIRDDQGQMWRHLPFRLGGCLRRERPVEGFVFSQKTPEGGMEVVGVQPIHSEPKSEGGEHMKEEQQEVRLTELARMGNVSVGAVRGKLLRKGIPIIQRKTDTGMRYSVVAAKDLQTALEHVRAIRPRVRVKEGARRKLHRGPPSTVSATAREAKSLQQLRAKGILSETEYQAAEAARRRKYEEAMGITPRIATPEVATPNGDASKALGLIRRVIEQNNISFLHFENGKMSARRTVSEEVEA